MANPAPAKPNTLDLAKEILAVIKDKNLNANEAMSVLLGCTDGG